MIHVNLVFQFFYPFWKLSNLLLVPFYLQMEKTNNQPSELFFIFKINELRLDQSAPDKSSPLCIERKKANQTYYTMNPFTWK